MKTIGNIMLDLICIACLLFGGMKFLREILSGAILLMLLGMICGGERFLNWVDK